MRTIKMKVVAVVMVCVMFASCVCGFTSISKSKQMATSQCNQILNLQTENLSIVLDSELTMISQAVDTLAASCLNQLDDIEYFQTSSDYVMRYTSLIQTSVQEAANNAASALTCYIRFNPEYTEPKSGIFMTRDNTESEFSSVTPTDFSMYDPDDVEHVGWYYIPVNNGKPTWMEPYLNENINVYMISYVVPLYLDGVSIGIVGMDIDFSTLQRTVKEASFFDTGYAYLVSEEDTVLYHPNVEEGTPASEDTKYGMKETDEFLKDSKLENVVQSYTLSGKVYDTTYTTMVNGMKVGSCVPQSELLAESDATMSKIILGTVISLIIALIIGILFSLHITKPLNIITSIIKTTAELDFRESDKLIKLCKKKDETGAMSIAIRMMQQQMRELVQQIEKASTTLKSNIRNLENTTNDVDNMSVDNSAISEELAASMQETAASSDLITQNVGEVVGVASSINGLSDEGVASAKEIQARAAALLDKTNRATEQTNKMYEEVSQKSQLALQQAKSVDKINEMTNVITEISSQTNLLALNASIEAARAGDAGRGFAVVASEIGNLANQTLETVGSIDSIVQEVVNAVENMAFCLKNSTDFLENTVLSDYKDFAEVSVQYTDDAKTFDSTMRQIQTAITNLTDSMNGIGNAISEINTTIGEATNGVNSIAESSVTLKSGVSDNLAQVQTSIESIENLNAVVSRFKI